MVKATFHKVALAGIFVSIGLTCVYSVGLKDVQAGFVLFALGGLVGWAFGMTGRNLED